MTERIITIFGVPLRRTSRHEVLSECRRFLSGGTHQIATVNPEFLLEAKRNERFRSVLQKTDLNVIDGFGIAMVAALKFQTSMPRMTGVALIEELARLAASTGATMFLFGGFEDTPQRAAEYLRGKFQGVQIVGAENEWDASGKRRSDVEIVERIQRARPDILCVAFGQVRQELWIADHRHELPSVRIAVGVGGTFDFFSGRVRRAPRVFQRLGFEWLWRLALQPWRFRRIVNAVVRFPIAAFLEKTA